MRLTPVAPHEMSALEKLAYAVLVLLLAVGIALIAFSRADDGDGTTAGATTAERTLAADPRPQRQETEEAQASEGVETRTEAAGSAAPPLCTAVTPPSGAEDPVTCRTRSATLTIAGEDRPVVLGGTQVRLLRATLTGRVVIVRLRVRNETDAEQGVVAGGQEIYLNLQGITVNPEPVGDVRVAAMQGTTTTLRYVLTPPRLQALRRLGGEVELGVRPWTDGEPSIERGVIRFDVIAG